MRLPLAYCYLIADYQDVSLRETLLLPIQAALASYKLVYLVLLFFFQRATPLNLHSCNRSIFVLEFRLGFECHY